MKLSAGVQALQVRSTQVCLRTAELDVIQSLMTLPTNRTRRHMIVYSSVNVEWHALVQCKEHCCRLYALMDPSVNSVVVIGIFQYILQVLSLLRK